MSEILFVRCVETHYRFGRRSTALVWSGKLNYLGLLLVRKSIDNGQDWPKGVDMDQIGRPPNSSTRAAAPSSAKNKTTAVPFH